MSSKTLFIVRHAKSSWDYENISDIDRPLKLRGIRDAYEMARRVKIERAIPELILCSPAARALHTANIFIRVFEIKYSKLVIDGRIYGSGVGVIRKLIGEQSDDLNRLMIFGHNPDFSELAAVLSGKSYLDIPTCGLVRLDFKAASWASISKDNMKSSILDFPKKENDL